MENWKPIIGFENYYEISNLGNVRSLIRKGKTAYGVREYGGNFIKPFLSSSGYPAINLTKKGYRKQFHIHSLLLKTFIGECPKNMEACHNNGIRTDFRLENLRWDTRKNNHKDQILHGTRPRVGIKINGNLAKEIKELEEKLSVISKKYNLSKIQIWRIKTNRAWNV